MYTDKELKILDIQTLARLYSDQVEELNKKLLTGADWQALKELRGYITQIGVAIDIKIIDKTVNK